ncbi:MAG: arginine N-succinyltransferase [Gammaproteobacteria bacterium]|nr:arginine N-succinyltransferase [Gammaproteobacteria bacterium]
MLVRAATPDDLAGLLAFARRAGTGLTSLPANKEHLAERLQRVARSFAGDMDPAEADYLFLLEDDQGEVLGTSALLAAAGLREPWYSYRVGLTVSASSEMQVYRQHPTLFLVNDLTGSTALCSLFLPPPHRNARTGRLLSKSRLLFMAEFMAEFAPRAICEIRGFTDAAGRSPFWDSLGRHFFKMEFARADYLTGIGSKAFIAEMMPRFPLYTCFLSEEARAAIGQVHPQSAPGLAMLQEEGFSYQGYVDIFDGGATVEAPMQQVRSIRDSQLLLLAIGTPGDQAQDYLIHNRGRADCRMTVGAARVAAGTLIVAKETAQRLQLRAGMPVRAVPLAPETATDPYAGDSAWPPT